MKVKKKFFVILIWVYFIKIFYIIEFNNFFFLDNKKLFKGKYKKNILKIFEIFVDEILNVLLM